MFRGSRQRTLELGNQRNQDSHARDRSLFYRSRMLGELPPSSHLTFSGCSNAPKESFVVSVGFLSLT